MARLSNIRIAVALLGVGVLAACAPAMLSRHDRKDVCQVAVLETPALESPTFKPELVSTMPAGMAAAVGALAGIVRYGFFPPAVVTTPMGAGYGAAYGAECVAAAQSHPNAEADFKEIFLAKYPGSLKEGLEMDLNAQREGCPREQAGTALGVAPDAVIEIQEVKFGMGCAFGKQKYWINVKWRALTAMNNRVLGETRTGCFQTSFWDVDDWFADPERARAEIGGVLNMVGKWMAGQLLSEGQSRVCELQSNKNGEIEVKR